MDDASTIHIFDLAGTRGSSGSRDGAVYLIRPELTQILNIYGKMVAAGEWHDYAIDSLKELAVFSIFRRASEMPLYRIIKEPALAHKQGMWRITGMDGRTLKRGKRLDETVPGTGLGLAIVAETASAYGGGVELGESATGGLKVEITLPAAGH